MCGGRGSRLDATVEKPLFEINREPMLDRVLRALDESRTDEVYAAVSPHAPETATFLETRPISCIETPGDGYVADLEYALERLDSSVLTVAADLPLLEGEVVDSVLDVHDGGSLTVATPVALKRVLGASVDLTLEHEGRKLTPTGINVVGESGETTTVTYDVRLAVNVNRRSDAEIAEVLS